MAVGIYERTGEMDVVRMKCSLTMFIWDVPRSIVVSEIMKERCILTHELQREIKDIKKFLELTRRADVKSASIKVNKKINAAGKVSKQTKFKVRGSRHLYTLIVADEDKAKKLQQALPSTLEVTQI